MGHNGNVADSLGIYISVPFCKAKCSFCNFASGVFAQEGWGRYLQRVVDEVHEARAHAAGLDVAVPERVDSIYLGGGTPSLLEPSMLRELFAAVHGEFTVETDAEVTAECATGQLSDATLLAMQDAGVNRLSFGVQSFVDREAATVGRTHTGSECLQELRRTTAAGIARVGIDLICGLPGQTEASWRFSINEALASGVEHVSVYMLEVDDGSRLGRESLQGGDRYGAGELPEDDAVAAWYGEACARLEAGGLRQYEISNFARGTGASRHNRRYWKRSPYLGFGLDAHSMLRDGVGGVRWANPQRMEEYAGQALGQLFGQHGFARAEVTRVGRREAFEETLFLGLRMNEGVSLRRLRDKFGELADGLELDELVAAGLVDKTKERLSLTARGRMVSNEVFERVLLEPVG
jgi:oxygen-independent coproporphyrinogen-3 oxidase